MSFSKRVNVSLIGATPTPEGIAAMQHIALIAFFFLSVHAIAEEWMPPENPDPEAILDEAQSDTEAMNYERALAKFVWFHHNALKYQPALYGVRLSFALGYWHELAKVYPPALAKLEATRDEAARQALEGKNIRESFHDMASINHELDKESLTKETFEALDEKSPKAAKEVYDFAQPALIKAKAYALCGKYLNPKADFSRARKLFQLQKKLPKDHPFRKERLDFAQKRFTSDATTLIALLAVNDRSKEAEEIANSAKAEWDDQEFHAAIDDALAGKIPAPWP